MFVWLDWDPLKTAWGGMLAELAAYKEQTGGFKKLAGMRKELAKWVNNQRTQRKLFDRSRTESQLTQDRVEALDRIHFTWAPQAGTGPPKRKEAEVTKAMF